MTAMSNRPLRLTLALAASASLAAMVGCAAGGPPNADPAPADVADTTAAETGQAADPATQDNVAECPEPDPMPTAAPNVLTNVSAMADLQLRDEVTIDEATATYLAPEHFLTLKQVAEVDTVPLSMLSPEDLSGPLPTQPTTDPQDPNAPVSCPSMEPVDPDAPIEPAEGQRFVVFTLATGDTDLEGEEVWQDNLQWSRSDFVTSNVEMALITEESQSFTWPNGETSYVLSVPEGVDPTITFTHDKNVQTLDIMQGAMADDAAASTYRQQEGLYQKLNTAGPETVFDFEDFNNEPATHSPTLDAVSTSTFDPMQGFAPEGMKWLQVLYISDGNKPIFGMRTVWSEADYSKWSLTVDGQPMEKAYDNIADSGMTQSEDYVRMIYLVPIDAKAATLSMTTTLTLDTDAVVDTEPFVAELTLV